MLKKYNNYKNEFELNEVKIHKQLVDYATDYLENEYQLELTIPIEINGRLSRSAGRFQSYIQIRKPVRIEISKKHIILSLMENNFDTVLDTLTHELIHYALFVKNLPHRDNDNYFIQECNRQKVSLIHEGPQLKHVYICENGHNFYSSNKFDEKKYNCGCGSKIKYVKQDIIYPKKK